MHESHIFEHTVLESVQRQDVHSIAVACLDDHGEVTHTLTYGHLLYWAAAIARQIRTSLRCEYNSTVPSPLLIAVVIERCALVIASIFGIWMVGGAYVPVPKDDPTARIHYLCSKAHLVLATDCPALLGLTAVLILDPTAPRFTSDDDKRDSHEPPSVSADMCAMVIHTSGSTGKPKGVICSHRCLWHSVYCFGQAIEFPSASGLLFKTPYQWRTAEYEMFTPLCSGGSVFVVPEGFHRLPSYLAVVVSKHDIVALNTVPTLLGVLVSNDVKRSGLQHIVAIGESLPASMCKAFVKVSGKPLLHNMYGLTETGMTSWTCRYHPSGSAAPVGRPQPQVSTYVVERSLENGSFTSKAGVGEVYFGGIMSSGYLHESVLTQERYVPASTVIKLDQRIGRREMDNALLFRTGDLGTWNSHGDLEILGRIDTQVQICGIRIELGEIESVLGQFCTEVAVVTAEEDCATLVAFLSGCQETDEGLRMHLVKALPEYCMPLHFVTLGGLPRLGNEKIDRLALRRQTLGLSTRLYASKHGAFDSVGGEVICFIDSLGFERLQCKHRRQLLDNLVVVAMMNSILYHWFWCVLIHPMSYRDPFFGHGETHEDTIALPTLHLAPWVRPLYRLMTQEWYNGAFIIAVVSTQSPQETFRFTRRDIAIAAIYVYSHCLPPLIALGFPASMQRFITKAETIQTWFLLSLLGGKVCVACGHKVGVHPAVQTCVLLFAFLIMPRCYVNLCSSGLVLHNRVAFIFPVDHWPSCRACMVIVKEVECIILYVVFTHLRPLRSNFVASTKVHACIFVISCILGVYLRSHHTLENDEEVDTWMDHALRLPLLTIVLLQTGALTCLLTDFSRSVHFRWLSRWMLACYLFNVNFLDIMFVSPATRWELINRLQAGGPIISGMLTVSVMFLAVVAFMGCVAPVLQVVFLEFPLQFVLWIWRLCSEVCRSSTIGNTSEGKAPLLRV